MFQSLVIGDPHFKEKNRKINESFVEKTLEIVRERNPNLVVVLGDILHDHGKAGIREHRRAIKFLTSLSELSFTVLVIGNHDRENNKDFLTDIHFFHAMDGRPNFLLVDKVKTLETPAGSLFFVPYVWKGRFEEALRTEPPVWEKIESYRCGFSHQEFYQCVLGENNLSTEGDKWPLSYPPLYNGHIHKTCRPQPNIFCPGTPFPQAFDEVGNKGLLWLTFKEDKIEEEMIYLDLPKKITLRIVCSEVETFSYEGKDQLRLEIQGTPDDILLVRKSLAAKNLKKQGVELVYLPQKERRKKVEYRKVSYANALRSYVDEVPPVLSLYEKLFGTTI